MDRTKKTSPPDAPKRNHHGRRCDELARRRLKRRLTWAEGPARPLPGPPPSLWDVRDALDAARRSGHAALRAGWLVHRLQRTAGNEYCGNGFAWWMDQELLEDTPRKPTVRSSLCDTRWNGETESDEDIDLRPRYKTLMRCKRLWERFADRFGLDRAADPEPLLHPGPAPLSAPLVAARAFLDRHATTAASLSRALNRDLY